MAKNIEARRRVEQGIAVELEKRRGSVGRPRNATLVLVKKIVDVATNEYGIATHDIVIDPLAMPIGADTGTSVTTFETMRRIRDEFGLNMTCGASNVSFGMPERHALNATWLPMAMTHGLTCAIMDTRTPAIVDGVKAADLLLNHDEWGMQWIARSRAAATQA